MRTTITLDPDVVALVDTERARTGESFKQVVNRLLRRASRPTGGVALDLPLFPGLPLLDVVDASAVLAALDDERGRAHPPA